MPKKDKEHALFSYLLIHYGKVTCLHDIYSASIFVADS